MCRRGAPEKLAFGEPTRMFQSAGFGVSRKPFEEAVRTGLGSSPCDLRRCEGSSHLASGVGCRSRSPCARSACQQSRREDPMAFPRSSTSSAGAAKAVGPGSQHPVGEVPNTQELRDDGKGTF